MFQKLFQDPRSSISYNGWTLAHGLHLLVVTQLVLNFGLWDSGEFGAAFFTLLGLLSPLFFQKVRSLWSYALLLNVGIYSYYQTFSLLFIAFWPAWIMHLLALLTFLLVRAEKFCFPLAVFENYRLLLGVCCASYFVLVGSIHTQFDVLLFVWGVFLIGRGFLWHLGVARFFLPIEACIVALSLGLSYLAFDQKTLKPLEGVMIFAFLSVWNFLIWPARRQQKPQVEKWRFCETSEIGWGWARWLRLEQWRASVICFELYEGPPVLVDELGKERPWPEVVFYLMRSSGGVWLLWAKCFEKMPLGIQKFIACFLERLIQISKEEIPLSLLKAIEQRKR